MRLNGTELARLKAIADGKDTSAAIAKKTTGELRLFGLIEITGESFKDGVQTRYGTAALTEAGGRVLAHYGQ